jgi:hypothetical protein
MSNVANIEHSFFAASQEFENAWKNPRNTRLNYRHLSLLLLLPIWNSLITYLSNFLHTAGESDV